MFSFYLSKGSGSEGFLKIGSYDLEKYAKTGSAPQDIVWTNVIDDGWTIPLSSVQFKGGKGIEIKAEQLQLDTGLSYALVPPRDIESIIDVMKEDQNMTCKKAGNYDLDMYECDCTKEKYDKLKPLELNINGKWMKLPVAAWMSFSPKK